jgi:4-phospho-D-threonate 3-dehydrogenase / 4-phospho-D-erythronate 3-dehydrogenase
MTIAITMGDSSGVGPEIILSAFSKGELPERFVVIGDFAILEYCNELLAFKAPLRKISRPEDAAVGVVNILDLGLLSREDLQIGKVSRKSGQAALQYVECATRLALEKRVAAIVTQPINKEATRLSQAGFCGHTEYIADLCRAPNVTMMLVSEKLIVTHISTHVSLREAIDNVRNDRIVNVLRLTDQAVRKLRPRQRIAVAGLNPHAGENGAFGLEDQEIIKPAIVEARQQGIDAVGPFAPDTLFMQAVRGDFDAVVCMYHDQGHIPLKLLDFEGGVNVTLGLPIIRTSVDHGTAFDIAYQGRAFTRSLRDACQLAEKLATGSAAGVR